VRLLNIFLFFFLLYCSPKSNTKVHNLSKETIKYSIISQPDVPFYDVINPSYGSILAGTSNLIQKITYEFQDSISDVKDENLQADDKLRINSKEWRFTGYKRKILYPFHEFG